MHQVPVQQVLRQDDFHPESIYSETFLQQKIDYIHYNPVKHGYVSKPENWPHSSFHTYLSEGWYETGWGHTEPQYLKELNFE